MVLLFVYPFQWFQRILNRIGCNSLILRTFMEVFQGPFKDGTNDTNDYRYFSGFFLLLPLVLNLIFSQTLSSFYYPMVSLFILIYLLLLIAFQPYKQKIHNYITIGTTTAILGTYYGCIINAAIVSMKKLPFENDSTSRGFWLISIILLVASISSPFLYLTCLACVLAKKWVCSYKCMGHYITVHQI